MGAGHVVLTELGNEMATTRRLLERVPADKGEWKPHGESYRRYRAAVPRWVPRTTPWTGD